MRKNSERGLRFGNCPAVSLSRDEKSKREVSGVIVSSVALVLVLLSVLYTLHATMILPINVPSGLPMNFDTIITVIGFGIGATLLFNLKRFKGAAIGGVFALLAIIVFWFRQELYNGILFVRTKFLQLYNFYLNTNFLTYSDELGATSEYSGVIGVITFMVCFLLSLLFGYLIYKKKAAVTYIILSLPLLWAAVNFSTTPLVVPIITMFFAALSLLALENITSVQKKGNSEFRVKTKSGRDVKIYNGGVASSRTVAMNLIMGISLAIALVVVVTLIFPSKGYVKPLKIQEISKDPVSFFEKVGKKLRLDRVEIGDLTAIFSPASGMSGGNIVQFDRKGFKGETHLLITPDYQAPMLLKGYVGSLYSESRWRDLPDSVYEENEAVFENLKAQYLYPQALTNRFTDLYDKSNEDYKVDFEKNNNMEFPHDIIIQTQTGIKNVKADTRYLYLPYAASEVMGYSDSSLYYRDTIAKGNTIGREFYKVTSPMVLGRYSESTAEYHSMEAYDTYYFIFGIGQWGFGGEGGEEKRAAVEAYDKFVYENYLQMPQGKYQRLIDDMQAAKALNSIVNEDINAIIEQVKTYLNKQAEYDLSPGKLPSGKDYIEYFLYENHRGYCTNFATAGVMLFRAAGIPARYVEGYTVTEYDYTFRSDPDGSIKIEDSNAHAWVEIYMNGNGWVAVDVTPGFSSATIADHTIEPDVERDEPYSQEPSSVPSSEVLSEVSSIGETSSQQQESSPQDGGGAASGSQGGGMSKGAVVFLTIAGMLLLLAAIICAKWWLVLQIRNRRFNQKNKNKAIIKIYRYALELLAFKSIEPTQFETELDFAKRAEAECEFVENGFAELTKAALKACFSNHTAEENELKQQLDYVNLLSKKIYITLKPLQKLWFRLIDNL